jgi:H+-transporting ATPase
VTDKTLCGDAVHSQGVFQKYLHLPGLSYGQIITAVYLKVSISDFLTLFSSRTQGNWFWTTAPSPILLGAGGLALMLSTILAAFWPECTTDSIWVVGLARRPPFLMVVYVWLYCLAFWFIQDAAKVLAAWAISPKGKARRRGAQPEAQPLVDHDDDDDDEEHQANVIH